MKIQTVAAPLGLLIFAVSSEAASLADFTKCISAQGRGPVCQLDAGTYQISSTMLRPLEHLNKGGNWGSIPDSTAKGSWFQGRDPARLSKQSQLHHYQGQFLNEGQCQSVHRQKGNEDANEVELRLQADSDPPYYEYFVFNAQAGLRSRIAADGRKSGVKSGIAARLGKLFCCNARTDRSGLT